MRSGLTHQIEVNAVVHKIVLTRLDIRRRREIHTVFLADVLDIIVRAGQADDVRMEFLKIRFHDGRRVARRIAGDENRTESVASDFLDLINHLCHLVELLWADVWAMCEAEVDLR